MAACCHFPARSAVPLWWKQACGWSKERGLHGRRKQVTCRAEGQASRHPAAEEGEDRFARKDLSGVAPVWSNGERRAGNGTRRERRVGRVGVWSVCGPPLEGFWGTATRGRGG